MAKPTPLRRADSRPSDRALLERLDRIEAKLDLLLEQGKAAHVRYLPGLVDALREHFGSGPFTVRGLLSLCDEDPHCAVADELAALLDWEGTGHAREVALGMLLARLPELEVVRQARGTRIYRVRNLDPASPAGARAMVGAGNGKGREQ